MTRSGLNGRHFISVAGRVVGAFFCAWLLQITPLAAGDTLNGYLGSWGGTGRVQFENGKSELIKCAAYYTGGGDELRISVRCANPAYTIKVRSRLSHDNGQLKGTWEETTFNASGEANGQISENQIMLAVTGSGFTGTMFVIHDGDTQTVNIAGKGGELDRVSIVLVKHKKNRRETPEPG